jgi:hypothetical protein
VKAPPSLVASVIIALIHLLCPALQVRGGRLCKLTGLTTETNLAEEIASLSRTDESFLLRSPHGDSEDGKNLAQRQAHPLG